MNMAFFKGSPAAPTVAWLGTQYTTTVDSRHNGGLLGAFESRVPAGGGPPLHVHHYEDEVIHVLAGEYEFWLDGDTFRKSPGASVFLPRGVPHTFRVVGDRPGRNLAVLTPGGFERFFVKVATQAYRIPEDMAALTALAQRYGLEFRGPAPWTN